MAKALMFFGTSSESGKSIMAAAFCRIFKRRGWRVAPFKSQNMALNSGVTPDGMEMGRAQIVQAEAAGIVPHVDMNPILLKPTSEKGSQVIVHGVVKGNMEAECYYREKKNLWPMVTQSYDRLASQHDLIILEGAGSPVEINLKDNDIVNVAMAEYADADVVLVADIDRGGVFASIAGTVDLLEEKDRRRLTGFIINKFRGDSSLLRGGLDFIKEKTGYPVLGVVPYIKDIYIPGEDSVMLEKKGLCNNENAVVDVGIMRLPHISNYTDFDPLECDPRFSVEYITPNRGLKKYDVIIIPGSKNVFSDYNYLDSRNFKEDAFEFYKSGGRIIGICGGYQMLGELISDPHGVEGMEKELKVLCLLPVLSEMGKRKVTRGVSCSFVFPGQIDAVDVDCYEIHMGRTGLLEESGFCFLSPESCRNESAGIATSDGRILGTYLHGLFDNDTMRTGLINWVKGGDYPAHIDEFSYRSFKENNYDRLADVVEKHVDVENVFKRVVI